MCGITGFTGEADKNALKIMTAAITHRGPDEDGFYMDGRVNLGMRRLSIIDVETGKQPIHNEDKTIWVIINGEIYNYVELWPELVEKGHSFYTDHSDSEVVVHLYEEFGDEFVHKLNGMFAIAIWDTRKERLLLIRDRMGVKPLFYSLIDGKLIFSSEIKSILKHPAYTKDVNHDAIYHYFTFKNIPAPLTAFSNIHSLLPGEMLSFSSNGNIQRNRYWKVNYRENYEYDEAYVTQTLFDILKDAVRLRMRSDVPFGAYLSGGVDSSSVVALMTEFSNKPVKTFALGYEDELKNKEADLYHARRVAKYYHTEHYEYIMSHQELIDDIGAIIESFDQPFSGTISTYFLSKLITKHVKVALSGDGADELFGSYLSHRTASPMYHYKKLYEKVLDGSLSDAEKKLFDPCDTGFLENLYSRTKGDEVLWRHQLYYFTDQDKEDLLSDHFKSRINGLNTLSLLEGYFKDLSAKDPLNRILEMEWNTQFPDQILAFVDFLSMAHSVEVRSPFIDYRLVEFCATIPGHMKIKNGNVKDILKRSVEPILPAGITQRPKEGFVLPIFDWMVEKLKAYCVDVLAVERQKKHNYFNSDTVVSLLNDFTSGRKNNAGQVWNLMMFQVWWEKYFG